MSKSADYLKFVSPTYIENWPSKLHDLSIQSYAIPLSLINAQAIGQNIIEFGEAFFDMTVKQKYQDKLAMNYARRHIQEKLNNGPPAGVKIMPPIITGKPADITKIEDMVRLELRKLPGECGFVRLGSRSPKDSYLGHQQGFKVKASDDLPLRFVLDCSERMYEDLKLALNNFYNPSLFVREWLDLEKWQEWRCFVKDRELVGISQYYYHDGKLKECVDYKDTIYQAIHKWYEWRLRTALHLNDVVFDVVIRRKEER